MEYPKQHKRTHWLHQDVRPGDPPYGNIAPMEKWAKEQEDQRIKLAKERASYGGYDKWLMRDKSDFVDKDFSHLQTTCDCPICGSTMISDDQDFYKCTSYKCGHEARSDELGV